MYSSSPLRATDPLWQQPCMKRPGAMVGVGSLEEPGTSSALHYPGSPASEMKTLGTALSCEQTDTVSAFRARVMPT